MKLQPWEMFDEEYQIDTNLIKVMLKIMYIFAIQYTLKTFNFYILEEKRDEITLSSVQSFYATTYNTIHITHKRNLSRFLYKYDAN